MPFDKKIEEFPWMLAFFNKEYSLKKALQIHGWLGKLYGILFFIGGGWLMALPSLQEMEDESAALVYSWASVNFLFGLLCFISGLIIRFKIQEEEEVTIFRTLRVVSIVFSILDFPISLLLWVGIFKSNKRPVKYFIIYRYILLAVVFVVFILGATYGIIEGSLTISKYCQGLAIIAWFHFTISNNVLYLNMMYIETIKSVVTYMEGLLEKPVNSSTKDIEKNSKENQMGWVIPNKN